MRLGYISVMQIRNLSRMAVPTGLWHALADVMKVGGQLPDAIREENRFGDFGVYGNCSVLRVTVRPARALEQGPVMKIGSYTCGRISLFPCTKCRPGTLTQVFLHELAHAWMDQYHQQLHWSKHAE